MFVPDIPIMQVDTYDIIYKNKTVDKTNYIDQVKEFEGKKIVQVGDKKITIIESKDDTSIMIVIIGSSFVLLILLGLVARYFWNRMQVQKAHAEQIRRT